MATRPEVIDSIGYSGGGVERTVVLASQASRVTVLVKGASLPTTAEGISLVGIPATFSLKANTTPEALKLRVLLAGIPLGRYDFAVDILGQKTETLRLELVNNAEP